MHARKLGRGDRAPLAVFGALVVSAYPLLLWLGRGGWFVFDEWDLLAKRTGGNLGDLFRPHYQHWMTLPILAYRLLWQMFGIRTYVPYQSLSIIVHLAATVLLFVVMRRSGVTPWLATIFAGVFIFFGSGADNILFGFLISFVGSLAFGLVHLLLADHDGPVDRRDWLGLLAGFAGMLCSGIAVTMVIVVGLAVLIRRGWRVAALHTVPLAAVYLTWLAIIGRHQNQHLPLEKATPSEIARFVAIGVRAAFSGLGQLPGVGLALALVLLVGLPLAFAQSGKEVFRRQAAVPIALLCGSIIFLAIAGTGRAGHFTLRLGASGPEYARQSRYVHLVIAMMLPALALAANAILRRSRTVGVAIVLLPLVGVPGNVQKFADYRRTYKALDTYKEMILVAPRIPRATQLPRSVEPGKGVAPGLTLGWLLSGARSGRVPRPRTVAPADFSTETLRLALGQRSRPLRTACRPLPGPVVRVLEKEQALTLKTTSVTVIYLPPAGAPSRPLPVSMSLTGLSPSELVDRVRHGPLTFVALAGPLRLRIIVARGVVACER
ncbi:MAG: hypothetical protein JWM72_3192 [Actinomycetia bacterium]|nr:hypothetical protein [Actinomycetes bacterium]